MCQSENLKIKLKIECARQPVRRYDGMEAMKLDGIDDNLSERGSIWLVCRRTDSCHSFSVLASARRHPNAFISAMNE